MQQHGIDFSETFAPVVTYDSHRVLLAVTAAKDLELAQFDVQTAFLYGDLSEDIYMELPQGLEERREDGSARKSVVCHLQKSLYGLKQAPRCWNAKFREFLKKFDFEEAGSDSLWNA